MAYTNYSKPRYQWDLDDGDWDSIGSGTISAEAIIPGFSGFGVKVQNGLTSQYQFVRGALHRETSHQLWLVIGRSYGSTQYRLGYTGVDGTGVVAEDAESIKSWVFTHLVLWAGVEWTSKWQLTPVVVVPDPVVTITASEEVDDGHLRTQFRRQSILRRRNA